MHGRPGVRRGRHGNQREGRVTTDDALDDIRRVIRATMRLSFDKLLQLGYSRDSAKALLLRMTSGIVGQFDEYESQRITPSANPP
jgi:hypothetical protein